MVLSVSTTAFRDEFPPGSLLALQITDTHVFADPGGRLLGVNTLDSLDQVLALARERFPTPDFILATGDLVHDASPEGYVRIRKRLSQFGAPVYCLPGNHDVREEMERYLRSDGVSMPFVVNQGRWLLVFLDSVIPWGDGGRLRDTEIELLRYTLKVHPDTPTLICLHHQPIPVDSLWLDTMAVENGDRLISLVKAFPQVQCVLFGHIHQLYDRMTNNKRFLATPSTCIQFTPLQADFGVDNIPPGFRWLVLLPDGGILTGILRLDRMPDAIDLRSRGY